MPMVNCFITEETLRQLVKISRTTNRDVHELAEAAIAEAALRATRDTTPPAKFKAANPMQVSRSR